MKTTTTTTTVKGALVALIPLTAIVASTLPDAPQSTPVVAAADVSAAPSSAVVQQREGMIQNRASRSRPLIVRHRPVRRHEPVRVVAQTRTPVRPVRPVRVVRPKVQSQAAAVSFSNQEMRVRSCESGLNGSASNGRAHDFDYKAENPSSTASGAWQFVDGTWNDFGGYSHAASAPRSVQDQKARNYIDSNGVAAWDASRSCWGS